MKKFVLLLSAVLIVAAALSVPVFAHGHSGSARSGYAVYTLCSVDDCHITYTHRHGGTWYGGHSLQDGHDYHAVCGVSSCVLTTVHDHNGTTCFPHNQSDGHSYHISVLKGRGKHH